MNSIFLLPLLVSSVLGVQLFSFEKNGGKTSSFAFRDLGVAPSNEPEKV